MATTTLCKIGWVELFHWYVCLIALWDGAPTVEYKYGRRKRLVYFDITSKSGIMLKVCKIRLNYLVFGILKAFVASCLVKWQWNSLGTTESFHTQGHQSLIFSALSELCGVADGGAIQPLMDIDKQHRMSSDRGKKKKHAICFYIYFYYIYYLDNVYEMFICYLYVFDNSRLWHCLF